MGTTLLDTSLADSMLSRITSTLYIQAHNGFPGFSGMSNVIATPSRASATLNSASGGARSWSSQAIVTGIPPGATVSWISAWSDASGGTLMFSIELDSEVTFLREGQLVLSLQPIFLGGGILPLGYTVEAVTALTYEDTTQRHMSSVDESFTASDAYDIPGLKAGTQLLSLSAADSAVALQKHTFAVSESATPSDDYARSDAGAGSTYTGDQAESVTPSDAYARNDAAGSGITAVGTATYQSRSTSGSLTITLPSGVAENDIIMIWIAGQDIAALAISGYTRDAHATSTGTIFYKRAGSSESDPSISSFTGDAICAVFRGCTTSGSPFDATAVETTAGLSATQALTGITTATDGAMVIAMAYGVDAGWDDSVDTGPNDAANFANTTSGFCSNLAIDGDWGPSGNNRNASGMWYAVKSTAGASGTTTVTLNVTETWPGYSVGQGIGGFTAALKPA